MKRGVATAKAQPIEPRGAVLSSEEIVRAYYEIQLEEKALEKRKNELKAKLYMLIPAGEDACTFHLEEYPGKRFVARRIEQDRRKPDDEKLVTLLEAKAAPPEAFLRKPNEAFVAAMVTTGQITQTELERTLVGKVIEYVSLTPRKDGEED